MGLFESDEIVAMSLQKALLSFEFKRQKVLLDRESFNCHQCRAVVLTFVSIMSVTFGERKYCVLCLLISSKQILKPRSWKRQVDWVYASASRSRISIIASLWNRVLFMSLILCFHETCGGRLPLSASVIKLPAMGYAAGDIDFWYQSTPQWILKCTCWT